jgi:hypothetical protein
MPDVPKISKPEVVTATVVSTETAILVAAATFEAVLRES